MGLTRLSITRPLAMLMFILTLVIMGWVARSLMRVDRFPNISFPFVSVSVGYPGASPDDVERLVTQPIENSLSGITGISSISSTSRESQASIFLQLVEGADADRAAIDVARKVASVRSQLPQDIGEPSVNKADPNSFPIINIALVGERPPEELFQLANDIIQPKLQSLVGVADVNVSGGLEQEVQVQVDYSKLGAYSMTLEQVVNAIRRENVNAPAGSLDEGRGTIAVRSVGSIQSPEELNNLIVASTASGPIYLRNVAKVVTTYKKQTRLQRFNGVDSVGMSITKQSDANTLDVADSVRSTLEQLRAAIPQDVKLIVTNDNSRFIRRSLDAVQRDLVLAMFLTSSVLLLFLHSWRNTVIVALAIPTSLISTFLVMYALGFSLNLMTLMALAMTIGILVDDSIVVLENIHRHFAMGETPWDAALKGRSEIGLAAIAITLTDIVVYLPVAFMQGNIGRLFREYGLTIATATLFSLFISFTLTPMLASRWLKRDDEQEHKGGLLNRFSRAWDRGFDRVRLGYGVLIGWSLGHRPLIVAFGALALAGSLALIPFHIVGTEYAPQEDESQFSVSLQMPPGTALVATDAAARELETKLLEIPEVVNVFASVGGRGAFSGGNSASFSVETVEKKHRDRSVFDIMNDVRRLGRSIPEASARASVSSPLGGGGAGIQIRLQGEDLDTLYQLAPQVEAVAKAIPGIADVTSSFESSQQEVRWVVDREQAAALGVTASSVSSALRTAVQGGVVSKLRRPGEKELDITVVGQGAERQNLSTIASVPLLSGPNRTVRLGQVARLESGTSPIQITRTDRQRTISISAAVTSRPIGDVARELRQALVSIPVPIGYQINVRGQVQQLETAFAALTAALALSVLLIYMLLVALYESWFTPLSIMFALPLALVGAFLGLYLTGNTFNIFSMMGIIALMGLVAKNSILLIDYTNTLRARGVERWEAMVEAGRTRLRPILMTQATLIAAMTPLALKIEAGGESRSPMAVVIIGGVISSTLLTLVVVPVVYTLLDDLQILVGRLRAGQPASGGAEAIVAPAAVMSNGNGLRARLGRVVSLRRATEVERVEE